MPLYRATSKGQIPLTAEEEAETRAEWAANEVKQVADKVEDTAMTALKALDDKSIRAIREWIIGQPGASAQALEDIEAEVVTHRSKLRGQP